MTDDVRTEPTLGRDAMSLSAGRRLPRCFKSEDLTHPKIITLNRSFSDRTRRGGVIYWGFTAFPRAAAMFVKIYNPQHRAVMAQQVVHLSNPVLALPDVWLERGALLVFYREVQSLCHMDEAFLSNTNSLFNTLFYLLQDLQKKKNKHFPENSSEQWHVLSYPTIIGWTLTVKHTSTATTRSLTRTGTVGRVFLVSALIYCGLTTHTGNQKTSPPYEIH